MLPSFESHVIHHNDDTPKVSIRWEKNSRGNTYEIHVSNCKEPGEAVRLIREAEAILTAPPEAPAVSTAPAPAEKEPEPEFPF